MKHQKKENGWVIVSNNGTFILDYTFKSTRTESIKEWMSLWDPKRCSWPKFRRKGYQCRKATRKIELD